MKIKTLRFGEFEVQEEDLLHFTKGLLGFRDEKDFVLLNNVIQAPFMWLQSVKTPELAFVVLDPWLVEESYQLEISEETKKRLKITDEEQVMTLGIVVIPKIPEEMTINLRAPLVINVEARVGEQIILNDDQYVIQHPIYKKNT